MPTRQLSVLLASLWAAWALSGCADLGRHEEQHADRPHWAYAGAAGAERWGDLQADYATCKTGRLQSPIDIQGAAKADLQPLGFHYVPSRAEVVNNGHTIQINLTPGNSLQLESGSYKLVQFHFHTPSEEKINGKSYPLVAHMVHRSDDGKLAVVAVLFTSGRPNPTLDKVFAVMPDTAEAKLELSDGLNPADLLPVDQGYFAYMGSLTTPPCSEGVRWHVLKQPVELSPAQLSAFRKLYPMNARPTQEVNGRAVQETQ
jgi:carbonic anhydrase